MPTSSVNLDPIYSKILCSLCNGFVWHAACGVLLLVERLWLSAMSAVIMVETVGIAACELDSVIE